MPPDFGRVIRNLKRHEVEFVVLGASAAIAQGAPIGTIDLDLGYRRTRENVSRLVEAMKPFHPRLRGVTESVPFTFTAGALLRGCNHTLVTDAGDIDLLGHITGPWGQTRNTGWKADAGTASSWTAQSAQAREQGPVDNAAPCITSHSHRLPPPTQGRWAAGVAPECPLQ